MLTAAAIKNKINGFSCYHQHRGDLHHVEKQKRHLITEFVDKMNDVDEAWRHVQQNERNYDHNDHKRNFSFGFLRTFWIRRMFSGQRLTIQS